MREWSEQEKQDFINTIRYWKWKMLEENRDKIKDEWYDYKKISLLWNSCAFCHYFLEFGDGYDRCKLCPICIKDKSCFDIDSFHRTHNDEGIYKIISEWAIEQGFDRELWEKDNIQGKSIKPVRSQKIGGFLFDFYLRKDYNKFMSLRLSNVFNHAVTLHFDVGSCKNDCIYCFAKSKCKPTSTLQIQNAIAKQEDPGLLNFYVKHRFPVFVSDHSDIFGCHIDEMCRRQIELLKELEFPILYLTKGTIDKEKMNWFEKVITPNDAVLLTITGLNDKIHTEIEPGAPLPSQRIKFLEWMLERKINVEICFSPVIEKFISESEILSIIDRYSQVYGWSIHRLHCSSKEKQLFKYLKYTFHDEFKKELKKRKIALYTHSQELAFLHGLGNAERKIFKKPVICSDNVEDVCERTYKEFSKGKLKKELIEYPHGYCGINYFIECNKEVFDFYKNCIVKKSEIKAPYRSGSYYYAALPDRMSFIDYFKILWENPDLLSPMNYSRTRYGRDGAMFYWYVDQPYFMEGDANVSTRERNSSL